MDDIASLRRELDAVHNAFLERTAALRSEFQDKVARIEMRLAGTSACVLRKVFGCTSHSSRLFSVRAVS